MGLSSMDKILKIPVLLSIDIITLKSTTKPPIITTVFTEDIILFCKILPRVLNLGGAFLGLLIKFSLSLLELDLYFQNLKIIPTVRLDKR